MDFPELSPDVSGCAIACSCHDRDDGPRLLFVEDVVRMLDNVPTISRVEEQSLRISLRTCAAYSVVRASGLVPDEQATAVRGAIMCVLACWGYDAEVQQLRFPVDAAASVKDILLMEQQGKPNADAEGAASYMLDLLSEYFDGGPVAEIIEPLAQSQPFGLIWATRQRRYHACDNCVDEAVDRYLRDEALSPMALAVRHLTGAETEHPAMDATTLTRACIEYGMNVALTVYNKQLAQRQQQQQLCNNQKYKDINRVIRSMTCPSFVTITRSLDPQLALLWTKGAVVANLYASVLQETDYSVARTIPASEACCGGGGK